MNKRNFLACAIFVACLSAASQGVVRVGKGSYAAYTPLSMCYSPDHEPDAYGWRGDQSRYMQSRKLYITERENQPIPTNDWWTNLMTEQYSGHLWSYPQMIQAKSEGLCIQRPSFWIDDGTEMKSNTVLTVGGDRFKPVSAVAESWHDWDVEFSMREGDKEMYVTMAHGIPFTWLETRGITPTLQLTKSEWTDVEYKDTETKYYDASHSLINGSVKTDRLLMERGGDMYGIYLPKGSLVEIGMKNATVYYPNGMQGYIVVALLNNADDLGALAEYAVNVPRDTRVGWKYDVASGKMLTTWHVDAENLATSKGGENVMQGFLPHQWRDTGFDGTIAFNGMEYATPHGRLRMSVGNDFKVDYKFCGMLPYWALPLDTDRTSNPYDEQKMMTMLTDYANKGTFGSDTYWGGKGLTQMALYMMMAREMGKRELFDQCRKRLKEVMVNWLTYTPGEKNYFFARYDRWGALVGYSTSFDSDTFNDHHFHYGYFTLAGALLALVDDDFRDNYGQMLRLVAKDYANWQRTDTRYPLFRTFDPWAGHSFAGGMGDGNGNGQESSSEAMQSWGGLYLLGVALRDDEMRDAGILGWLSEARATAEYWFDRHRDNINYEKFKHPYNSNLTCHGVGWWTYFGYQNIYMQGIQWMPTSTALDYLSEDKAFAKWDYEQLFTDPTLGGWFETKENGSLDKTGDWGNVTLSYLQRSDPEEAARLFDLLWESDNDIARTSSTNGITYFSTHSHLTNGDLDWTVTASIPTARVYVKADGTKTHIAYNPTDNPVDVAFSDGYVLSDVPARQLKVEGQVSNAVTDIVTETEPVDIRDSLLMPNLALHKPCTASSFENYGTVAENATDGDDNSRWGSEHRDGEWIQVDLQQEVSLYQLRIHWEAAYASNYTISLSADGNNWTYSQNVNSAGGWDAVKLGDRKARYVRITGNKRGTEYGVSLYEIQAFGTSASASNHDIQGVRIIADRDVLKQGEPSLVMVKGYTCSGEWTDVKAYFSTSDGSVSDDGEFVPSVYGMAKVDVRLSADGDAQVYSQSFPVEEKIYARYVTVSPRQVQVIADGTPTMVEVDVQDQFRCPYSVKPNDMAYDFYLEQPDADGKFAGAPVAQADIKYDEESHCITASRTGRYSLVVHVVDNDAVADTIAVEALNFEDINLAYQKTVVASSQNGEGSGPEKAVDGDTTGTRWESVWQSDDENITVDLENSYYVNKVVVYWENARAKEYELQVSEDGESWQTVKNVKDSPVGGETITFSPVPARYVRIQGISRVMEAYGYSIYELQVYGTGIHSGIVDVERNDIGGKSSVYDLGGRAVPAKSLPHAPRGIYVVGKKRVFL